MEWGLPLLPAEPQLAPPSASEGSEYLIHWVDTASRWVTLNSPLYGKGDAPEGTMLWDLLILSHIAPARRSWSDGMACCRQSCGTSLGMVSVSIRHCPLGFSVCSQSVTIIWSCAPDGRKYTSRSQGVKVGMALLPITPNKPGREFTLPFPTVPGSAGLEILVSKRKTLPSGNTVRVPLNSKLWLLTERFWFHEPRDHHLRTGFDPDQEVGLYLYNKGREIYVLPPGGTSWGFGYSLAQFWW